MTELVWEGKYDQVGRRTPPVRVSLPFQTVEAVNESAQQRQKSLDLFGTGRPTEWRNRPIWGTKSYVLSALLAEFANSVDLIYIDPPFATGQNFSLPINVGEAAFVKEPSMIETKAYRDTWGQGLDSYLRWFYEMAVLLADLLSPTGSLYVHLEPGVSHLIKVLLDEVLGTTNFRNEISWKRTTAHSSAKRYGPVHDSLLFYTKSDTYTWNKAFHEQEEGSKGHYKRTDDEGRHWEPGELTAPGVRHGETGEPWRGFNPTAMRRHWSRPPADLDQLDEDGRIYLPQKDGAWPRLIRYLDDVQGIALQDVWTDIPPVNMSAIERAGYPTQKPVALLERLIGASTKPGDLVLDCVCGSGTAAVTAEKMGRRWIAADLGRFAIHTTRKRLLSLEGVTPFVVQNLGKYERQLWQTTEFGEVAAARTQAYRNFILELYKAKPITGFAWLHGIRQGRMVHVGTVDSPVTTGDIKQIAIEFRRSIGGGADAPSTKSVDVLGWDFAFELNEVAKQEAAQAGIEMRFWRIPREVLDKRAVDQGDIRFFELAALAVDVTHKKRVVTALLTDFIIPLDDVPLDIQQAISNWRQWIDYWAIDWDNREDTFHNQWQAFRPRGNKDLEISASHTYDEPGQHRVVVKVIDILGNDTTKTILVDVP